MIIESEKFDKALHFAQLLCSISPFNTERVSKIDVSYLCVLSVNVYYQHYSMINSKNCTFLKYINEA